MELEGLRQIRLDTDLGIGVQYCLLDSRGRSETTRVFKPGRRFDIPDGAVVSAIRLTDL